MFMWLAIWRVSPNSISKFVVLNGCKVLLSCRICFERFFSLMGTVFGFVSSDVHSKIEILEEFRKRDHFERFATFDSMLNYEKTTGLLNKSDYVSGSRTLLRLHRGLGSTHFPTKIIVNRQRHSTPIFPFRFYTRIPVQLG